MSYKDFISECCGDTVVPRKCDAGTIPVCIRCAKVCKLEPKGNRAIHPEDGEVVTEAESEIV